MIATHHARNTEYGLPITYYRILITILPSYHSLFPPLRATQGHESKRIVLRFDQFAIFLFNDQHKLLVPVAYRNHQDAAFRKLFCEGRGYNRGACRDQYSVEWRPGGEPTGAVAEKECRPVPYGREKITNLFV